ncbi:hypothetical protein [Parasphingopyxis sp.]|uniref:hypothetical protein n=1 Tax=Parasphingopyxis sp. TaxID=1920299 RepID=UPI002610A331|nr:hypothetical protein [Parasphingopyxis sp.]
MPSLKAQITALDDFALADLIEWLGTHCHGYDLNADDVAERMREDAETPAERARREMAELAA